MKKRNDKNVIKYRLGFNLPKERVRQIEAKRKQRNKATKVFTCNVKKMKTEDQVDNIRKRKLENRKGRKKKNRDEQRRLLNTAEDSNAKV